MNDLNVITVENHRSRDRIKDLGEVFTPEQYVNKLLARFDEAVWSDENVTFFEPSVGHGNIAVPIVERRIVALRSKYQGAKVCQPELHAVATTLNTFWAIDICPINVELTRKRCLDVIVTTLVKTEFDFKKPKMREFIAHALCALSWQIQENEALSALGDPSNAQIRAERTKLGQRWIAKNRHRPIDFNFTWCNAFQESSKAGTIHLTYQRALRFVEAFAEDAKPRGFSELAFAKEPIQRLTLAHPYRGVA